MAEKDRCPCCNKVIKADKKEYNESYYKLNRDRMLAKAKERDAVKRHAVKARKSEESVSPKYMKDI